MAASHYPVTVLMPVYNGERYLASALESVLGQTFAQFQLLVIDDGSTDNSLKILRRYARHDVRLKIVSRENRGLVATLNEGLETARGDFVARMDADDIALPRRLEMQVAHLEAHDDVVCLGGYYELIDYLGRYLTTMMPPHDHAALESQLLAGHTPICHPSAMMRRAVAIGAGGYDPKMMLAEDLDLWLRLGEVGNLAVLPAPVVQYRLHGKSVSEKAGLRQRQVARAACEQAWKRRGIAGNFDAAESARPLSDRRSRLKFSLLYGWWAFNSGQRTTALSYGMQSVMLAPWHKESVKLLACAAIKKLPRPEITPVHA
jgi:glycosyltransferase involved in cell wall biosynthesis